MIERIKKLLSLPKRPWTVCADKRTSAAYLVYDKNGDFHDDLVNDERAKFIECAINNHESLYDALLAARTVVLWAINHEDSKNKSLFSQRLDQIEAVIKKVEGDL